MIEYDAYRCLKIVYSVNEHTKKTIIETRSYADCFGSKQIKDLFRRFDTKFIN